MIGKLNKSSIFKIEVDEIQRTDLIEKYKGYIKNISSEVNQSQTETESEKHKRNNENKVNSKLAKLANVSPAKLFRYKAIKREGTLEDIAGVQSGEKKVNPIYEEIKLKHRAEEAKQEQRNDVTSVARATEVDHPSRQSSHNAGVGR